MRKPLLAAALIMSVGVSVARGQRVTGPTPAAAVPAPVTLASEGKFQTILAKVGSDMFIAGQPTLDGLRQMRKEGVTTVVNLRTPEEMAKIGFDEAAEVTSLGMEYVYLPVRGNAEFPYSPAVLTKFSAAMKHAKGGVLLHCTVAWRASHLWAAYLIQERGIPIDVALAQARTVNLMDANHDNTGRMPV